MNFIQNSLSHTFMNPLFQNVINLKMILGILLNLIVAMYLIMIYKSQVEYILILLFFSFTFCILIMNFIIFLIIQKKINPHPLFFSSYLVFAAFYIMSSIIIVRIASDYSKLYEIFSFIAIFLYCLVIVLFFIFFLFTSIIFISLFLVELVFKFLTCNLHFSCPEDEDSEYKVQIVILHSRKFKGQEKITCGICLEEIALDNDVGRLKCHEKHVFHIKCLATWAAINAICPTCKFPIVD